MKAALRRRYHQVLRMVVVLFAAIGLLHAGTEPTPARPVAAPDPIRVHALSRQIAGEGSIAVQLRACPAGMSPLDFEPARCASDAEVADLRIFVLGSGENRRNLDEATHDGDVFTWDGLPFGEYVLQATGFAPGYDRYLIPGFSGLNISPDLGYGVSPNEGFILPLDAAHPAYALDVYVFRTFAGEGAARVNVRFWECAPGVPAAPDMRGLDCAALAAPPEGFALEFGGVAARRPFDLEGVTSGDGGLGWDDVPSGEYRLTARLPAGIQGYAVRSYDDALRVHLLSDRSGYALVLDPVDATPEAAGAVSLDVYLLR